LKRIESFNILRVVTALGVLLYHLYWCFGCRYGEFDHIAAQSTYFMTTFFVLGGFVIGYSYYNKDFFGDGDELLKYFKKRFDALFPTYILIFVFFMFAYASSSTLIDDIFSIPFQLTMTFGFEHYTHVINSGAWFFSLLFMSQLFGPYLLFIAKKLSTKKIIGTVALAMIMLGCAPYLKVMVYASFVMRMLEFYIGIALACIYIKNGQKKFTNEVQGAIAIFALYVLSLVGVFILHKVLQNLGLDHSFYGGYNILACSIIIYLLAMCDGKLTHAINCNKVISTVAKYSMEIWCGTFFSSYWNIPIKNALHITVNDNIYGTVLTFICGAVLAGYRELVGYLGRKYQKKFTYPTAVVVCVLVVIAIVKKYLATM